jgi:molecular chaperone DnaJ
MSVRKDLYIILEIGRSASEDDIRKAFRKLARRYHPDINPGDSVAEERFKMISEAYEILSDPPKREFYDANGFYAEGVLEPSNRRTGGFTFQGFDFSRSATSPLSDVLGSFFTRQASRLEVERGQDLEYPVSISFEDSIRGCKITLNMFRKVTCALCNGSGRGATPRQGSCSACGGTGKKSRLRGHLDFTISCNECGGAGRMAAVCGACGGEGCVSRPDTMELEAPAGVSTGSRVRYPGKGDAGVLGGPAGDLYLVTNVAPHHFFKRFGDNIHCSVPISIPEAALGTKIEVPTIDGCAVVRIPPGTQSGQSFRLRGKGAPSLLQPGSRGDQYVEVKVVVPRIADERSREILREFARLNSDDPRKDLWSRT